MAAALTAAILASPARQTSLRTMGPVLDGIVKKPDIPRIRELMAQATERTTVSRVVHAGWNESRQISRRVPTAKANESHDEAMRLARDVLEHCGDVETLSDLRAALSLDPMYDVRDPKFRDQPAPLVEEINAKLALLTRG